MIDYLRTTSTCSPLFFFFKSEDAAPKQVLYALRTILVQLCLQNDAAFDSVKNAFQTRGYLAVDSITNISSMLQEAVAASESVSIPVIFDALDECTDVATFVQIVKESFDGRAKILATSRDMPVALGEEQSVLSLFDRKKRLDIESTSQSVNAYIQTRALRIPLINRLDDPSLLVNGLKESADGLWLAAKLLLDEAARVTSFSSLANLISNGPSGLSHIYDSVLKSREANMSNDELHLAGNILLWLDIEDYNPLSYMGPDLLSLGTAGVVMQFANQGETVLDAINLTTHVCSPLVQITAEPFATTVHFIHLSALQHVRKAKDRRSADLPCILRPQRLRQLHRANTAAWYFTNSADFREILQRFRWTADRMGYDAGIATDFTTPRYFDFAYGLWSLLKMEDLPADLDRSEIELANRLIHTVIAFLTSSDCLTWVSYALILNVTGRWVDVLAANVVDALDATCRSHGSSNVPAWSEFNRVRRYFMENYLAILYDTAYWDSSAQLGIKFRYREIWLKDDNFPMQYRDNEDRLLASAPLDSISSEASYYQNRLKADVEKHSADSEEEQFKLSR